MVATVEETEYFVDLARDYGIKTAGVMVEVPSSALLADRILGIADFASIGTNDLTQYTLAADRLLGSVAAFQDPWHPAVLRLIGEVGAAGAAQRQARRDLRRSRSRSAPRRRPRRARREEPVDGTDRPRRRARVASAVLPRRCDASSPRPPSPRAARRPPEPRRRKPRPE